MILWHTLIHSETAELTAKKNLGQPQTQTINKFSKITPKSTVKSTIF